MTHGFDPKPADPDPGSDRGEREKAAPGRASPTSIGGPERGEFPPTLWTLVSEAQDESEAGSQVALAKLCEMYWYPLYAFVRRTGCSPHDAEDITQGFFSELLRKGYLDGVCAEKGRLRSFLRVSMKHYLSNWRTRARAKKRGGDQTHFSIDQAAAEERYHYEPADALTPEVLFDRHWALTLMHNARLRLRREYAARGKVELFTALAGILSTREATQPYARIAERFEMTPENVRTTAVRMRKRYKELLEEEILETVNSPEEAAEELRHLLGVFGG